MHLEFLWMPLEAVQIETHSKCTIDNKVCLASRYVLALSIGKYPLFT